MDVVIGPSVELHQGVHGSLIDDPPPGVRYLQLGARHSYLFAEPRDGMLPNPFDERSVSETVHYVLPAGPAVVHSSRLPVGNMVPWLADTDDLVATLDYGQPFALGSHARPASAQTQAGGGGTQRRLRWRAMLAHYVDPRCHAVLFRTDHARRAALRFIEDAGLLDERARADFAAKLHVVRPALPFRPGRALARPTRVLCSGRSFQDKGGTVALAVFRELHARLGALVELVLIGNVPLGLVAARPGFEILPVLPRDTYLRVLGDAHVFFSPTLFESFGMALLEAASRGLAIVTSSGDGMEHIDELFTDGQSAVLVPNGLPFDEQVRRYVDAIASLVNAPERLRALRDATGRLVESGALSIGRRDQLLLERYAAVEEAGRRVPESRWSDPTAALAAEHHLTRRDFSEEYLFLEIAARAPDRHFRIRIQDPG